MKTAVQIILWIIFTISVIQPQNINRELVSEAKQLMTTGRYGEAIDLLNRFIAVNPQQTEGYMLRGTCYVNRGDFEFAVNDFRTAKRISPSDTNVNNLLNSTLTSWKKLLLNNIEGYKREIAIHPDKPINYLEIGKAYKNLGEWREAEIWYDEYLKRDEPSPDEVLRYTGILAKNNQLAKGEKILKRYTELQPDDHRLWSRYGYFSYWLGKKKTAVSAFEKSLLLRPFFKEAADGLDLAKGKGYVYTVNDTTSRFTYGLATAQHIYLIDRLYAGIKRNPDDTELRFRLIDELIKADRYEEAIQQLNYLESTHSGSEKYNNIKSKVFESRQLYYKNKIEEYKQKLAADLGNTNAMLKLAELYSQSGKFKFSKPMYESYLAIIKDDEQTRYNFAKLLFWNNNICAARDQADILLLNNPDRTEYQLLSANILMRLNENLQRSKSLFAAVIKNQPDNKEALSGLFNLSLLEQDVSKAERYFQLIKEQIGVSESESLFEQIEAMKKHLEQNELFQVLEQARNYAYHGDCNKAVNSFEKYFDEGGSNQQVYFELAEAYQCMDDYKKAISIYDEMIELGFDGPEVIKQRAKIIFWSGDSIRAFREFEKLNAHNSDDLEIKLFLADSFLKLKQYKRARDIYNDLLRQSPGSHIVKMRLEWLGSEGIESFSVDEFPTYVLISPEGNYFSDNTSFDYSQFGTGIEFGFTNFLAAGISGYRGTFSSDLSRLNFNILKGALFLKFNNNFKARIGAGQSYFVNGTNENIFETAVTLSEKELYDLILFYNRMDAAFVLYSPFLTDTRLNTDFAGLNGEYNFVNGMIISGKYSYINVSDDNSGNQIQFRIGHKFQSYFKGGYEYYYYTMSEQSDLYWSPELFEAHSVWADFELVRNSQTNFTLGGKIGLIPENDFLLREFHAQLKYKFTTNFNLQASLLTGSSSRAGIGYNSTGFRLAIFWSP